jgi:hypothetical protein
VLKNSAESQNSDPAEFCRFIGEISQIWQKSAGLQNPDLVESTEIVNLRHNKELSRTAIVAI